MDSWCQVCLIHKEVKEYLVGVTPMVLCDECVEKLREQGKELYECI